MELPTDRSFEIFRMLRNMPENGELSTGAPAPFSAALRAHCHTKDSFAFTRLAMERLTAVTSYHLSAWRDVRAIRAFSILALCHFTSPEIFNGGFLVL